MLLVLATLMLPASATLIPLFVLMSSLELVNTYPGLVLPFLAGPLGVFLTRQFFLGLPDELLEAARIDGAGEFRIFCTDRDAARDAGARDARDPDVPGLRGTASSTRWSWPRSPRCTRCPFALATFATGQFQADHGMLMAGSVILVLPVLIVFVLMQRWITEGHRDHRPQGLMRRPTTSVPSAANAPEVGRCPPDPPPRSSHSSWLLVSRGRRRRRPDGGLERCPAVDRSTLRRAARGRRSSR